ncbi:MAG: rhodanese-like domain-containing protein [Pirellulales bacterium]
MLLLVCSLVLAAGSGCGRNKFEQEIDNEKLAVNLVRETRQGEYDVITAEELKKLLDARADLVLIDAMPSEEYRGAHIPGAKQFLFPKEADKMEDWDAKETGGKTADDYAELLGPQKDRLIVVYCGFVQCARSHHGARWARRLGYTNVKRFPGGIYAWKGAAYSTSTGEDGG